ncbi:syntaxin-7-like [Mya arenaria]|uniref:syntaxin-7-like n=1 Tax=Mya arenaria TaxID=6604 RepID=UPI0022E6AC75|nr:syntaxin-7-like [Mya arenaria]
MAGFGSFREHFDQKNADQQADLTPDQIVGRNLEQISRNVMQIKAVLGTLERSVDIPDKRRELKDLQNDTQRLTKETDTALKKLARNLDKTPELRVQERRLKEIFQGLLSEYSGLQKTIRFQTRDSLRSSLNKSGNFDIKVTDDGSLERDGEQIQIEQIESEAELNLIKERESDLKQLEQDITDINSIFKDLSEMVEKQGEKIDISEKKVEKAVVDVEVGVKELEIAKENVTPSRRKKIALIVIVVVLLVVVVTIIVIVAA